MSINGASTNGDEGDDLTRTFSVFSNPAETVSTVIVGAGIIGCATAYLSLIHI